MIKVSEKEKAEAREKFENQLRFAFARFDHNVDDGEENAEVSVLVLKFHLT